MTDPRSHGPYEVAVEALGEGRGQGRRAGLVALTIIVVIGSAVALARLSDHPAGVPGGAPTADAAGATHGAPGPRAPGEPGTARASTRPVASRVEQLNLAPDRPLQGAPRVTVVERLDNDLRILAWKPGEGLARIRTVKNAIAVADDRVFPVLSPDGGALVLLSLNGRLDDAGDRGRLIDLQGKVLWAGEGLTAASGALWSADSRIVVTAGRPRRWHLVTITRSGSATERVVSLPGEVFLPSPTPLGSISIPDGEPRTIPLGFSADGRWIYGGVISPQLNMLIGQFRVSADGLRVEPLLDFRVGLADGLVPRAGTLGDRYVDPTTGRIASWRVNSDTIGGPQTIEVRNPDAGFLFSIVGTALGAEWGGDGGLYVLSADSLIHPARTTLARVGLDGTTGPPIFETGPVTTTSLVGIGGSYAVLATLITRPSSGAQLVMVKLDDPSRIAAVPLPDDGLTQVIAATLEP